MSLHFFTAAPRPADEAERQAAVNLLRKVSDPQLDALVREAAEAFECPMALISIVDRSEQWFVASVGIDVDRTARATSFCGHTIASLGGVMCIPDATLDRRFAGNPFVLGEPGIRYYFGASLLAKDGARLGSFCVLDTAPRAAADPGQRAMLQAFAEKSAACLLS
jgi:GAF domain-containing protein